jgi:colicin import membrane protein
MAEQKESSVLFSLKELMNLEEDRIKQEADEKKRRADSEVQSRLDAERRAREQEQARLLAEEDRRRNDELRKREEAARLEAIRHAEIEKARVEAEQRARMEAMTQQQEHERQLSALKHDEHKKKLQRNLMLTGAGAFLVIGLGVGWYLGIKKPADERERAALAAAQLQRDEEVKRLTKQLEDQQTKVGELMQQLASAQDDKTRAELKQKLAEAQRAQQGLVQRAAGGGPRPASGGDKPKPPCNCQPGDPLCSCL